MPAPTYAGDRRQELCAWLTANNIDPKHVPLDTDLHIEEGPDGRHIHLERYVTDAEGRKVIDERRTAAARENLTAPLLVEPPDWWEPYVKPSRDALLEAVGRVLALHADDNGICRACTGEAYATWPCPTIQALGDIAA